MKTIIMFLLMSGIGYAASAPSKADKLAKQIHMLREDIKDVIENIKTLEAVDTIYAQQMFEAQSRKECIKKTDKCPIEIYEDHRRTLQAEISDAYEEMRLKSNELDKLLNFLVMPN